jgi:hypothetical protein
MRELSTQRFCRNQVILFFLLIGFSSPGFSGHGIACDPGIRSDNTVCPNGNCRRIGGSCGPFGWANWLCLDGPTRSTQTALGLGCASLCTGSTGLCETNVTPCNTTFECDPREICLDGVCSVAGDCVVDSECADGQICRGRSCVTPQPPEPPECQTDADCGGNQLCLSQQCVLGDCRGDFECRTDEACINNQCGSRCPEGETWVPNPIGYPAIPLGRCQADDSLVGCCYNNGNPYTACRIGVGAYGCPVNFVCSTTNVCYSICGSQPCPSELPRLPRNILPPDQWERLLPAGPPTGVSADGRQKGKAN